MPRNGRRQLPSNIVYRSIHAVGGPTAVTRALKVSLTSLARWRREGRISDARIVLEWAALIYPAQADEQLRLARRLAGLPSAAPPRGRATLKERRR
jgi:hypothetical protein